MAIVEEIHIGDIGTIFEITLMDDLAVVNVAPASEMLIMFTKPDGSKVINIAQLSGDGSDGKIRYVITSSTELDQNGSWKIQANVTLPSGQWSSNIDRFRVYKNL